MNPFYRRLLTFGQLVQQLSRLNRTNYNDLFELEHPGVIIFNKPKEIKPKLYFKKPCPKQQRNQIKKLFKLCFDNRQAA